MDRPRSRDGRDAPCARAAPPRACLGPNPRVGACCWPRRAPLAEGLHRGAGTPMPRRALAAAGERLAARPPSSRSSRATTPAGRGRAPSPRRGRRTAGWCLPSRTRTPRPQAAPTAARGPASTSRRAARRRGASAQPRLDVRREHGRPFVTWKFAATLDGRSAAADGTSGGSARGRAAGTHRLRGACDTILVGTGTALVDDPRLTVARRRGPQLPREQQPLRAVMGLRDLPADLPVFDDAAETVRLRTRDPCQASRGSRARPPAGLARGWPDAGAAFLRAGLVDEVVAYLAPALLGGGGPP